MGLFASGIKQFKKEKLFSWSDNFQIFQICPATAFGLGIWQVKRRSWKLNLLEELDQKTSAPPIELPINPAEVKDLEFSKVQVRGQFEVGTEVYVGPRSIVLEDESGGLFGRTDTIGFHVITPFKLENSEDKILVNRGWVPKNKIEPSTRGEIVPSNVIELTGVVRLTDEAQRFKPKNPESGNKWSSRDVEALAEKFNTLPIFIDADQSSTVKNGPIGGQTRITLPNDHLSYLITWFSLSAVTSLLWIKKYVFK